MSETSDAAGCKELPTAEQKNLIKVRGLLRKLPNEVAPWCEAIGESSHKSVATKLSKAFDTLLPGLFSFPIPTKESNSESSELRVVSANIFSEIRLTEEIGKFSFHSPKLTVADADKNSPIPLDRGLGFPGSDLLIGAHSLESGMGLDFYSGANSSAIYKQIRHVMNNADCYALPSGIEVSDLSDELIDYLKILERVVRSDEMYKARDVVAIPGLPQILIPCADIDGGYLCITPLASGGVLAAVSDSIKEFSFEQNDAKKSGLERRGILTSNCMPMVGNKQNLSGLISRVKRIYFSAPPLIDKEARSAHTLINRAPKWAQQEFQNVVRSKDDPTVRNALRNVKLHIEEILGRGDRSDPLILDATTPNERAYEVNAIKFMTRPLIKRWIQLCLDHSELAAGTKSEISNFDVSECGDVVLSTVVSAIGIAVSEHTKAVWLQGVYCEIHEQLKCAQEGMLCGSQ